MKHLTVKLKISIWLTLLMSLLAALLATFMLSISSMVATQTAASQLAETLKSNLSQVSMTDGSLNLGDKFHFYRNGVSTLIYSKNEALLAGQIPVSYTSQEPFQNGASRTVSDGDDAYLVLDFWIPAGWEEGVWVRGLMETPNNYRANRNLLIAVLITLPIFIIFAAIESYRIIKRAFSPLENITATASAINEARDLSQRINLPKGHDEFSRLADTFDHLFERLELSFEAEKQFISDASHELRTPVSIIKGACDYAQKFDETPEEHKETIAMIHRQADKMSGLITQLLSMARLDQGTELAHFEPIDLGNLLSSLCEEQAFESSRLTLDIQKDVTCSCDPGLMSRLVQNLVENAFKYGKPDSRVWVSLQQTDHEILLQVRDNGIGIPHDQQKKIWQRFYQADPARSEDGGSGLGLPMVQQIARIHGGYMTLESVPELGSAFTLHLPTEDSQT